MSCTQWVRVISVRTAGLLALALGCGAPLASAAPPPAEAFAHLPAMSMARLSPDGQKLAWANRARDEPLIMVYSLAENTYFRQILPAADDKSFLLRELEWADNQTLLVTVSLKKKFVASATAHELREYYRTIAWNIMGGGPRPLLPGQAGQDWVLGSEMLRVHTGRPNTVVMASPEFLETQYRQETGSRIAGGRKDSGIAYSVFEVDTRTGNGKRIHSGTPFTDRWIVDGRGQPTARSEWNPQRQEFEILGKSQGGWKTLYRGSSPDDLRPEAMSADGSAVIAVGSRGGPRVQAWRIPLDGTEITSISVESVDVEHVIGDRFTGVAAGLQLGGLERTIRWFDPMLERIENSLAKTFAGQTLSIYDRSEDYGRVIARVEGAGSPPVYYLVDLQKGTADTIGDAYPALAGVGLGARSETAYKARDGIEIPAYLTLPPGEAATRLPLVVFPHGGPYARDDSGFDWWAQFMATRGYAVLQPQFRGSTGFGADFTRAGEREWGAAMQDDLTDGVDAMIERGIADPRRICIVGASYGGYAALTGVALTPEQYACAASVNGVTDLPAMYAYLSNRYGAESTALGEFKRRVGRLHADDLATRSPRRLVNAIRAPILLLHATNDDVVPVTQSESLARALAEARKPVRFVRLEGEDHWISTTASRLRILQELETFLGEHLQATPGGISDTAP
ncbi:MAG TPA: S9 family peptidase [Steroidobacteraceae bacterium]|nr:S9 family peptidase [Steroidobacteraceae bacterium]